MITPNLFWLAIATLATWTFAGGQVAVGSRRIGYLRSMPRASASSASSVCIILAARNEEEGVAAGVESLLAQRGLSIDVIAVDDRSQDRTGQILEALAGRDARLRVLHLDELPPMWLGKSYALQHGAEAAKAIWLLFTDADVVMAPLAVARAVAYAERHRIDHLAVTPHLRMPTVLTNLFGGTFVLLFSRYARPWKARDPRSAAAVGIGAFNLVRSEAYFEVGGHSVISLRPDDDMALARLLKGRGFRQDLLYGTGEVFIRWYGSLRDCVHGLEKNAFTGLGYSLLAVLASCVALLVFAVWPWLAVAITSGATRWVNAASVAAMVVLYVQSARTSGADPRLAPAFPAAVIILCYAILRAAALAVSRGEVRWRGTAYPLDELRRHRS